MTYLWPFYCYFLLKMCANLCISVDTNLFHTPSITKINDKLKPKIFPLLEKEITGKIQRVLLNKHTILSNTSPCTELHQDPAVIHSGNQISNSVEKLNLITVQKDATVFSSLHFCRQLYMFRVLTPIISSSYNCNYSFWY